jgi:Polysaccharide pyruvyl transferase
MRALVAGWFSFEQMGASAGDLLARDVVCSWLDSAGRPYDVAMARPFQGGVDWERVDPSDYSEVVFVCGPFGNGPPLSDFLERFRAQALVGVNLSMLEPLEAWDPFDLLIERDSSRTTRPDVSLLSPPSSVPVAGLVLIDNQPEYGDRDRREAADDLIARTLADREIAAIRIDTRLDKNSTGLRSPGEIEAVIARMDVVVTTRLHGTVLAIKRGVPPLVIDPVAGGAKVRRQAETIGWPAVFGADTADPEGVAAALDWCLSEEAREAARACCARGMQTLGRARDEFLGFLSSRSAGTG